MVSLCEHVLTVDPELASCPSLSVRVEQNDDLVFRSKRIRPAEETLLDEPRRLLRSREPDGVLEGVEADGSLLGARSARALHRVRCCERAT
jgi:hypothetical protein